MKTRCQNKKDPRYKNWGGRGIAICKEWQSFAIFHDWAVASGYAPGLQIDRINNDAGYSPDNCRWATPKQQAGNRTDNVWVTAFGETKLLIDWAGDARCVCAYVTLGQRIRSGAPPEIALTSPAYRRKKGLSGKDLPITAFGETKTTKEWSEDPRCKLSYVALRTRLRKGTIPPEIAITAAEDQLETKVVLVTAFGETKNIKAWSRDPRCATSYLQLGRRLRAGIPPELAITRILSKPIQSKSPKLS